MLLCAQYVLPITSEPIHNGAVLVRDGAIRDVGDAAMLKLRYPDEEVSDFGQAAILPGFVDLHTHLENAVMRGIVHDVPYATWIMTMRELSAKMDVADWYDSAILGGLESLSSGITTVADITTSGASCTAMQKLGMRGVVYREVGAMDRRRVDFAMHQAEGDLAHWQEEVDSDRLTVGLAPSSLFTCNPEIFRKVAQLASKENLPVALRLAGDREECDFVRYGSSPFAVQSMDTTRCYVEVPPWLPTGTTPVNYVLNWGAFESDNVMMVHGVYVDDHDVAKLKEYDVSVASCPRINAQLGMGVAPLAEFLNNGCGEHATDVIESMWGNLKKEFFINGPNQGAVTNLPDDAFLELRRTIDMNGFQALPYGEMPRGILGLTHQILDTHELTVEAALRCDRTLLLRALCTDPIVNNIGDARNIMNELLEAERCHLPQGWFE